MKNQDTKVVCYLCDSADSRALLLGRDRLHRVDDSLFQIYYCNQCGLLSLFPQPTEKELQKYYPEDYGPYHTESSVLKYGALSRIFKKILSLLSRKKGKISPDMSNARLLDFGCGGGAYLDTMRKYHPRWEFYGFDNNEHACAYARAKGFTVFTGNIENELGRFVGYFDSIHLGHVIEHLPDPKATLSFLRTLLKPGGEIRMTTPNGGSLAAKLFKSYWFALDTPRHLFLFSPSTISQLLSQVGYAVTAIRCTRDLGVEIRSINYLFERPDMRIPFVLWHLARIILAPIGVFLSSIKRSSVMDITAVKK